MIDELQAFLVQTFPFAERFEIEFGRYGADGERVLWDFTASFYDGSGLHSVHEYADTLKEAIEQAAEKEVQFFPDWS